MPILPSHRAAVRRQTGKANSITSEEKRSRGIRSVVREIIIGRTTIAVRPSERKLVSYQTRPNLFQTRILGSHPAADIRREGKAIMIGERLCRRHAKQSTAQRVEKCRVTQLAGSLVVLCTRGNQNGGRIPKREGRGYHCAYEEIEIVFCDA